MSFLESVTQRNAAFAKKGFHPELKMLPSAKTLIVGCVDPRVDPMDILALAPGEAAIIRNVGGRVNPALFETIEILGAVSRSAGGQLGPGWNLVVLHHTGCGIIGGYHEAPEMIATYMGVELAGLEALAITDPRRSVAIDVAALKAEPRLPGGFTVSGLLYDVATGLIETVVPPARD